MIFNYLSFVLLISAILLDVNAANIPKRKNTRIDNDPSTRGGYGLRYPDFLQPTTKKPTVTTSKTVTETSSASSPGFSTPDDNEGGIEIVGPTVPSVPNNQNNGLVVVQDDPDNTQKPFKLMTSTTPKPTTAVNKVTKKGFTQTFPEFEKTIDDKAYDGGIIEIYPDGHREIIKDEPGNEVTTPKYRKPSVENNNAGVSYPTNQRKPEEKTPKQKIPNKKNPIPERKPIPIPKNQPPLFVPVYPSDKQTVYEPLNTNKYEPISPKQYEPINTNQYPTQYEQLNTNQYVPIQYVPITQNNYQQQQQQIYQPVIVPYPGDNGNYQQIDGNYQDQNYNMHPLFAKHNELMQKKQQIVNNLEANVLDVLGAKLNLG